MVIIAFCTKTSKFTPRILCRHFRHCAPIIPTPEHATRPYVMYQFIRHGRVAKIPLNVRDMNLLRRAGWVFIWTDAYAPRHISKTWTCVGLCCKILGIKYGTIWTPDALYKYLKRAQ